MEIINLPIKHDLYEYVYFPSPVTLSIDELYNLLQLHETTFVITTHPIYKYPNNNYKVSNVNKLTKSSGYMSCIENLKQLKINDNNTTEIIVENSNISKSNVLIGKNIERNKGKIVIHTIPGYFNIKTQSYKY